MFEMQVLVNVKDGKAWVSVKGYGMEKPYRTKTREEAMDMLQKCYPEMAREDLRVIEVADSLEELIDAACEAEELFSEEELAQHAHNMRAKKEARYGTPQDQ